MRGVPLLIAVAALGVGSSSHARFAGELCWLASEDDLREVDPVEVEQAARFGWAARVTGREARHYVAFTFDDGPDAATTPRVLDALDAYGVPATFFVVGWRFDDRGPRDRANAAALHEVVRRGHMIGNHTHKHRNLGSLPAGHARAEIAHNELVIERELGFRPYLFRPPFGAMSGAARAYLRDRGYTEVRWAIDSKDWRRRGAGTLRARTVAAILAREGGVVLLHDTKPWTADALPGILDDLEAENCRRLAAREPLLVPVTLDFFIHDRSGTKRALPRAARDSADAWAAALPGRCAARGNPRSELDLAPIAR